MARLDEQQEIWKDIKGYEGFYQVSNMGRVRSVDRVIVSKRYKNRHQKGMMIKLRYDKDGYLTFNAKSPNKNKLLKVHREVAKCFVCNPNNYDCIDHIDGKRDNNIYTNLRWCTIKQNATFDLARKNKSIATKNSYINNPELRKKRVEVFSRQHSKKVDVYFNNEFFKTFNKQMDAANELNISQSTVSACLSGRLKGWNGYTFKRNTICD